MGRGRGKGKKLTATTHEDAGSGEEEKIPVQKKRGRPQKPLKDEMEEDEFDKVEEDNKGAINLDSAVEHRKKRKRNPQAKDKLPSPANERAISTDTLIAGNDMAKSNGFRQVRSRRKSTPHRAAEVGVRGTVFLGLEGVHQLAGISSNV